jgi:8-amino-7-oxononanoate synthase
VKLPLHLEKSLKEREEKSLLRNLKSDHPQIDFCSNDYLGFSKTGLLSGRINEKEDLKEFGSTGSRLISGNSKFIEEAEKRIAGFHNSKSALIFNSGYDANLGLLSSVPQKNDLVLYDELSHASIIDGIRLSFATSFKFRHNDIKHLKQLLQQHKEKFNSIFIVVESVYSMDGDKAPLKELAAISKEENVFLIVDEAHAIGVFGKQGKGLCEEIGIDKDCFARIYTYGKAMGCHGAAICGNEQLRSYLINFARSFIYTTALPNHSVHAILSAYDLLTEGHESSELRENISYFLNSSKEFKSLIPSDSAIQCLVTGDGKRADEIEKLMEKNNIYARAVKSPTVKAGAERVRFCIHSFNTKKEIDILISVLKSTIA